MCNALEWYQSTNLFRLAGMLVAVGLTASACTGRIPGSTDGVPTTKTMDGVRLIGPNVTEEQSRDQMVFVISSSQRLLMRFEELKGESLNWQSGSATKIIISLPHGQDAEVARQHLRLCPLRKNWMMAASWSHAHPFRKGKWEQPGGDFERVECVTADLIAPPSEESNSKDSETKKLDADCEREGRLCFDVSDWFSQYIIAAEVNYGHVLIADQQVPVRIFGDQNISQAPRIRWVVQGDSQTDMKVIPLSKSAQGGREDLH